MNSAERIPYIARLRARIADLEARIQFLTDEFSNNNWKVRAEKAEAALAERDRRRCEGCSSYHVPTRYCRSLAMGFSKETTFHCSRWTARAEEGSGDE